MVSDSQFDSSDDFTTAGRPHPAGFLEWTSGPGRCTDQGQTSHTDALVPPQRQPNGAYCRAGVTTPILIRPTQYMTESDARTTTIQPNGEDLFDSPVPSAPGSAALLPIASVWHTVLVLAVIGIS